MSGARRRALLFVAAGLFIAAALAIAAIRRSPAAPPPRSASERPILLLLTGLPLVFGEDFSLQGGGSEALKRLDTRYRVVPISVTDHADLAKGSLLLMAQPQTQTAENLVTLDEWVRGGGRVLLLADPMLEWPSKRPLGDPLHPPPMFVDTGLLGHWGLRLDAPDERGPVTRELGSIKVAAVSPGSLHGSCRISGDAFVAYCKVGKGTAIVVADADLLNTGALGSEGDRNLDALLEELAELESK